MRNVFIYYDHILWIFGRIEIQQRYTLCKHHRWFYLCKCNEPRIFALVFSHNNYAQTLQWSATSHCTFSLHTCKNHNHASSCDNIYYTLLTCEIRSGLKHCCKSYILLIGWPNVTIIYRMLFYILHTFSKLVNSRPLYWIQMKGSQSSHICYNLT